MKAEDTGLVIITTLEKDENFFGQPEILNGMMLKANFTCYLGTYIY